MQIHQLQPINASKNRKRVGRGGKKGTYSGKGGKGQTARAGRKLAPIIRELIKRYPKLKGYRAEHMEKTTAVVGLDWLESKYNSGDTVDLKHEAKILANGKLTKKLAIKNAKVSAAAKAAIEKLGGTIK